MVRVSASRLARGERTSPPGFGSLFRCRRRDHPPHSSGVLVYGGPRAARTLLVYSIWRGAIAPVALLSLIVSVLGASNLLSRSFVSPALAGLLDAGPPNGPLRCQSRCACVSRASRLRVASMLLATI